MKQSKRAIGAINAMRILHIVSGMQKASGVTTFVHNVADGLQKLGHSSDIVTRQSKQRIKPDGYDVIHIHGLWTPWLHSWAKAAVRADVPIVWSTHGMTAPWSMKHKWWKKCIPWYLYQKRDLRMARAIHCTVASEESWNRALGLKNTFVVPLGTRLPSVSNVQKVKHADYHTLLFVGRVYPIKAIDRLIEAFGAVPEEIKKGWRLRIVGPLQDDSYVGRLNQIISQAGVRTISFAGPKFDGELEAEYDCCDALALVSHTENFGATVADALAHSKPVITSVHTPWRDVMESQCGWWVPNDVSALSAALVELMKMSDSDRLAMGARGRSLIEREYTWESVSKKLEHAYERCCREHGPMPSLAGNDCCGTCRT